MRDDEKLEITAGQIRKLAEYYSGFKLSFPEVFSDEEKWEVIKDITVAPEQNHGGCFCVEVYDGSEQIGTIWSNGSVSIWPEDIRYQAIGTRFKFERKVSPCPK